MTALFIIFLIIIFLLIFHGSTSQNDKVDQTPVPHKYAEEENPFHIKPNYIKPIIEKSRSEDIYSYAKSNKPLKPEDISNNIQTKKISTKSSASSLSDKETKNNANCLHAKIINENKNETIINGHTVVFNEYSHTYYVDGKTIPSVSTIVQKYSNRYGLDDYANIPAHVLANAARKGVAMHKEIERYETENIKGYSLEFDNYLSTKNQYRFDVEKMERIVLFCHEGKPIYAGRLDMVIDINGEKAILDLKRTSKLYHEKVELQLNLYRLAYEQSYKEQITGLYCLRLRDYATDFISHDIDESIAFDSLKFMHLV